MGNSTSTGLGGSEAHDKGDIEEDGSKVGERPPELDKGKTPSEPTDPNPLHWHPTGGTEALRVKNEVNDNSEPCLAKEVNMVRAADELNEKLEVRKPIRHWYPKCEAENILSMNQISEILVILKQIQMISTGIKNMAMGNFVREILMTSNGVHHEDLKDFVRKWIDQTDGL